MTNNFRKRKYISWESRLCLPAALRSHRDNPLPWSILGLKAVVRVSQRGGIAATSRFLTG
jgi:hypothetical protein